MVERCVERREERERWPKKKHAKSSRSNQAMSSSTRRKGPPLTHPTARLVQVPSRAAKPPHPFVLNRGHRASV